MQTQPPTLPGADVTTGAGRWTRPLQTQRCGGAAAAASLTRMSLLLRKLLTQRAEAGSGARVLDAQGPGKSASIVGGGSKLTGQETLPRGFGNAALPPIGTTTLCSDQH